MKLNSRHGAIMVLNKIFKGNLDGENKEKKGKTNEGCTITSK
jgi:hypothetical protein